MSARASRAALRRTETCLRKRRYETWDEANAAALLVWVENPKPDTANPCSPYPCELGGERHYHYGHITVRYLSSHRKPLRSAA